MSLRIVARNLKPESMSDKIMMIFTHPMTHEREEIITKRTKRQIRLHLAAYKARYCLQGFHVGVQFMVA